MRMQVILDSSFARPGSAPIWGGKKGEFRDWTNSTQVRLVCFFLGDGGLAFYDLGESVCIFLSGSWLNLFMLESTDVFG